MSCKPKLLGGKRADRRAEIPSFGLQIMPRVCLPGEYVAPRKQRCRRFLRAPRIPILPRSADDRLTQAQKACASSHVTFTTGCLSSAYHSGCRGICDRCRRRKRPKVASRHLAYPSSETAPQFRPSRAVLLPRRSACRLEHSPSRTCRRECRVQMTRLVICGACSEGWVHDEARPTQGAW